MRRTRAFATWAIANPDYRGRLPGTHRRHALLISVPTALGAALCLVIPWPWGILVLAAVLATAVTSVIRSGIWIEEDHIVVRRLTATHRLSRSDIIRASSVEYTSWYWWWESGHAFSEVGVWIHRAGAPEKCISSPGSTADALRVDCNVYLLNRWILEPVRAAERAAGPRWPQPGDSRRLRDLIEAVMLDALATMDRPRAQLVERALVNEVLEIALDHGSAARAAERIHTEWIGRRGRLLDQVAQGRLRAALRATGAFDPYWWHGVQEPARAR